jgi:hypothetical protein
MFGISAAAVGGVLTSFGSDVLVGSLGAVTGRIAAAVLPGVLVWVIFCAVPLSARFLVKSALALGAFFGEPRRLISDLRAAVGRLEGEVRTHLATIGRLQSETVLLPTVARLEAEKGALVVTVRRLEGREQELVRVVEDRDARIVELAAALGLRDTQIRELSAGSETLGARNSALVAANLALADKLATLIREKLSEDVVLLAMREELLAFIRALNPEHSIFNDGAV